MLTLALHPECYVAYDLANSSIYKVWKGGVDKQGAAYTDKKNLQPTSWGTAYVDNPANKWLIERDGSPMRFAVANKGYYFKDNRIYIKHRFVAERDTFFIIESPEFIVRDTSYLLERRFTTKDVPPGVHLFIANDANKFSIETGDASVLATTLRKLPEQKQPELALESDHRGRYFMEKSDCFTCHEPDRQTVGPSFQQIAGRYGHEENLGARLVNKVIKGGAGAWGTSVMNPHPDLSEREVREMLQYIFTFRAAPKEQGIAEATPVLPNTGSSPGFGAPLEEVHPSYTLQTIHKSDFRPRVGAMAFAQNGDLLVTTWDTIGAVYRLKNVHTGDTNKISVKRVASGLAEPLGIEVADGEFYVLQKQELTKLIDHDGDEITDEYEAVCNSWGVSPDFHEFSFGLVYRDGYFYATLSMAMRLLSSERQHRDRGRTIRISKDGTYETINYGLRTPNGIGKGIDGELFVTDNQGEWVPANKLIHVKKGEYHGMRWGHPDSGEEPRVADPAIWLPENEIANSPSEPVLITEGIYKGQMLHGDVTYGGLQRDFLEKVNGEYQGAVFRFSQGFEAGINRMRWGPDDALYVGGVGMVGGWSWKEKQYGLQRLNYNGKPVFDLLAVRSLPDGFEIEFTEAVSSTYDLKPANLIVQQWWYLPTADYGGPKKDLENLRIENIQFSDDRKKLRLKIRGLRAKRVVYFRFPETIQSEAGRKLWSGETWYTLNQIQTGK